MRPFPAVLLALAIGAATPTQAADLQILTTGAYLPVASALAPEFEARHQPHLAIENDTAGAILARARGNTAFDLVILTPTALAELAAAGKIQAASITELARVGVGVMVKAGTRPPDISSVEALRQSLLNAASVAYIDPASGGSSGIYVAKMLQTLGIGAQIAAHAVLVQGGRVADHVARGEAAIGIQQISEILPVAGVSFVGPLPAALQNETIYSGAVGQNAAQPDAARSFLKLLAGPDARPILEQKGMQPAAPAAHP